MIDKGLLERLYKSYGFEVENYFSNNISIFTYKRARYFGVDIIPITSDIELYEEAEKLKTSYSNLGYAASIKNIKSNDEAELELFKSFFSFDSTRKRVKKKYNDFTKKQTKNLLDYKYQYIESPFELYNHVSEERPLFNIIDEKLQNDKSELIIIEAAAGYGKTCTAYEILNRIAENFPYQLPIFTELARNRGANIFKYILLDEIDVEFPSLNLNLVIKEIKNGRIPVIVDGFDELLEKIDTEAVLDSSFEEVESMLDTIGSLLEYKSKIILTTRKTAIFTGLEFESWLQKWSYKFQLTRIALKEPSLKDWLGNERYSLVKEKDVPIQYLANPVLLTFIKNADTKIFLDLIENPNTLVQCYFEKLLEREKERQDLYMTVENQLLLFKNVSKNLIELDSTVEDKEFFKLIILEDNKKLLEETKNLYSGITKKSVENLVDILCTHALLDRKGRDESQIGFINDFVFGTFIAQVLIETAEDLVEKKYSNYMIELAVTAYRVQIKDKKFLLWEKLQSLTHRFQQPLLFSFDLYLNDRLMRDYSETSLYDNSFFNILFEKHTISSSVFLNCYFKNCVFDKMCFIGVSFINCTFNNCKIVNGSSLDIDNEVVAIKCKEENCSILIENNKNKYGLIDLQPVTDFEKSILKILWSISNTKGHHIVKLTQRFDKSDSRKVFKSLKELV